jgi:hypothetical protein
MKTPTVEELKKALAIPKVKPQLDRLGRINRPTTSKSMMLKVREKSPIK